MHFDSLDAFLLVFFSNVTRDVIAHFLKCSTNAMNRLYDALGVPPRAGVFCPVASPGSLRFFFFLRGTTAGAARILGSMLKSNQGQARRRLKIVSVQDGAKEGTDDSRRGSGS